MYTQMLAQNRTAVIKISCLAMLGNYWVKGQNVCVVNGHQLISSMVKRSRAILECGQAVKQ